MNAFADSEMRSLKAPVERAIRGLHRSKADERLTVQALNSLQVYTQRWQQKVALHYYLFFNWSEFHTKVYENAVENMPGIMDSSELVHFMMLPSDLHLSTEQYLLAVHTLHLKTEFIGTIKSIPSKAACVLVSSVMDEHADGKPWYALLWSTFYIGGKAEAYQDVVNVLTECKLHFSDAEKRLLEEKAVASTLPTFTPVWTDDAATEDRVKHAIASDTQQSSQDLSEVVPDEFVWGDVMRVEDFPHSFSHALCYPDAKTQAGAEWYEFINGALTCATMSDDKMEYSISITEDDVLQRPSLIDALFDALLVTRASFDDATTDDIELWRGWLQWHGLALRCFGRLSSARQSTMRAYCLFSRQQAVGPDSACNLMSDVLGHDEVSLFVQKCEKSKHLVKNPCILKLSGVATSSSLQDAATLAFNMITDESYADLNVRTQLSCLLLRAPGLVMERLLTNSIENTGQAELYTALISNLYASDKVNGRALTPGFCHAPVELGSRCSLLAATLHAVIEGIVWREALIGNLLRLCELLFPIDPQQPSLVKDLAENVIEFTLLPLFERKHDVHSNEKLASAVQRALLHCLKAHPSETVTNAVTGVSSLRILKVLNMRCFTSNNSFMALSLSQKSAHLNLLRAMASRLSRQRRPKVLATLCKTLSTWPWQIQRLFIGAVADAAETSQFVVTVPVSERVIPESKHVNGNLNFAAPQLKATLKSFVETLTNIAVYAVGCNADDCAYTMHLWTKHLRHQHELSETEQMRGIVLALTQALLWCDEQQVQALFSIVLPILTQAATDRAPQEDSQSVSTFICSVQVVQNIWSLLLASRSIQVSIQREYINSLIRTLQRLSEFPLSGTESYPHMAAVIVLGRVARLVRSTFLQLGDFLPLSLFVRKLFDSLTQEAMRDIEDDDDDDVERTHVTNQVCLHCLTTLRARIA